MSTERLVALDIGVTPEAAVSGAVLLQTERKAFLLFNAVRSSTRPFPGGGFFMDDAGGALIELVDCDVTRFGYPNDEAWCGIPLTKGADYGVYEVENSLWKQELVRLNQFSFPSTRQWSGKHYMFLFHDSSFECIATELRLELSNEPFQQLLSKVAARVFEY